MTEELQTVRDNLALIQKDHRVKMTAWDDDDEWGGEGCYVAFLILGMGGVRYE